MFYQSQTRRKPLKSLMTATANTYQLYAEPYLRVVKIFQLREPNDKWQN